MVNDFKYIPGKGLMACRDIKKDEKCSIDYLDYRMWQFDMLIKEAEDGITDIEK